MDEKKLFYLICLAFLIYIFIFLVVNFVEILFLSFMSYKLACVTPELISDDTVAGIFDSSTCEITINPKIDVNSDEYKKTIAHEKIHLKQSLENRSYPCNKPFLFYLNEVEAYSMENFYWFS